MAISWFSDSTSSYKRVPHDAPWDEPTPPPPRRLSRNVVSAFVVVQTALLVLAAIGVAHLISLSMGRLRYLPTYSKQDLRDAGWLRPLVELAETSVRIAEPPEPTQLGGGLSVHNLSNAELGVDSSCLHLLVLTPLHNSKDNLPRLFQHLDSLAHPKINTSLGFLVGDEEDNTGAVLASFVEERRTRYREITVLAKDFSLKNPSGDARHLVSVQKSRRSILGKARTTLLMSTLRPEHDWVLWLDSDVLEMPPSLVQDLLYLGNTGVGVPPPLPSQGSAVEPLNDIVSPNVFTYTSEPNIQGYDLNNWVETEASLRLKATLTENDLLIEGRRGTHRTHLTDLRVAPNVTLSSPIFDSEAANWIESNLYDLSSPAYVGVRTALDGVGGVATLVRAETHRFGAVFPGWLVDHQLETEGFAVIAKRLGARIVGLPNYIVVHAPSG